MAGEEHWTFFRFVSRLAWLSKGWSTSSYDEETTIFTVVANLRNISAAVLWLHTSMGENTNSWKLKRFLLSTYYSAITENRSGLFVQEIMQIDCAAPAQLLLSSQKSQVPFYHQLTFLLKPLEASKRKQLDEEHFISSLRVFQDWIRTSKGSSSSAFASSSMPFSSYSGPASEIISPARVFLRDEENVSHEPLTFLLLPFITACFSEFLIPISLITIIPAWRSCFHWTQSSQSWGVDTRHCLPESIWETYWLPSYCKKIMIISLLIEWRSCKDTLRKLRNSNLTLLFKAAALPPFIFMKHFLKCSGSAPFH